MRNTQEQKANWRPRAENLRRIKRDRLMCHMRRWPLLRSRASTQLSGTRTPFNSWEMSAKISSRNAFGGVRHVLFRTLGQTTCFLIDDRFCVPLVVPLESSKSDSIVAILRFVTQSVCASFSYGARPLFSLISHINFPYTRIIAEIPSGLPGTHSRQDRPLARFLQTTTRPAHLTTDKIHSQRRSTLQVLSDLVRVVSESALHFPVENAIALVDVCHIFLSHVLPPPGEFFFLHHHLVHRGLVENTK